MQSSLIAVVFCILSQAAAAQCPVANADKQEGAGPLKARVVNTSTSTIGKPSAELIATAAAGTRNAIAPTRSTLRANAQKDDDHPRGTGTGMLLAALALMSGIALRRYSAPRQ